MALSLPLEEILIKAPTEAAAFAAGLAIHPTLSPLLRDLENFTWSEHPSKRLDLVLAAEVAAEDVDTYDAMAAEAKQGGYDADRFKWAYGVTLNAPGTGMLIELLRRNSEQPIDFAHGLRKAKLEPLWDAALRNLRDVRIPGPDLAYMVVRGVVPDGGTLPSALPTQADALDLPPQLALDTLAEATKTGWDAERFAALVARSGLAMAPVMAAQANFRGIISDNDYLLTIARGDLFPAYADPVREVSRQILTSGEYVEGQLRGFLSADQRRANTAKHGMRAADSDLLYNISGRGLNYHDVVRAEARGGVFAGPIDAIPAPILDALRRSNLRPDYYNLAYHLRYTYPTVFVLRALTEAGDFTEAMAHEALLGLGWRPDWSELVAAKWAGGTGASIDPNVKKAESRLYTLAQTSYINGEIAAPDLAGTWAQLGVGTSAQQQILAAWDEARTITRKLLTPSQVKKAWSGAVLNEQTGQPWTRDDALAALIARGYSASDANTFLEL